MALSVRQRIRIPAPVAEVWEVVADPFRRPGWIDSVTGVHGEVPKSAPLLAEQRFTVEGRLGLLPFKAKEEITAVWPGTMIAFHGECGPATYLLTLTVSELAGEGTSLSWDMELRPAHEPAPLHTRLALGFLCRAADRLARRALVSLRNRCRQGTDGGMRKYAADKAMSGE